MKKTAGGTKKNLVNEKLRAVGAKNQKSISEAARLLDS